MALWYYSRDRENGAAMSEGAIFATLGEMRAPQEGMEYYALTLFADETDRIQWTCQSSFFGHKSQTPIVELRIATPVVPEAMISLWRDIGEDCCVASDRRHLSIFLQIGGNALVECSIAEKILPDIREPFECRPSGIAGFVTALDLPKTAFQRAPTPSVRMQVLKRDGYRCRLCGRRPADYVDVELHVHHARPWSDGGATVDDNLISLCNTCHRGLNPHFERKLFDPLGIGLEQLTDSPAHKLSVTRYRILVRRLLNSER
jgi:hypothetical protein